MRQRLAAACVLVMACQHAATSSPSSAAAHLAPRADPELCDAQRAENRSRAEAIRCASDDECVHAGRYETGTCEAWVTRPDADEVLRQMRAATDAACRDLGRVFLGPACRLAIASCVAGSCVGKPSADLPFHVTTAAVLPEDARCLADSLHRVTAGKKAPRGSVTLRFPLPGDGSPPWYFEAVGPHDPNVAVAAARAFGTCRWRLEQGGEIPPGTWGSMSLTLQE